jgi:hypothetical protein
VQNNFVNKAGGIGVIIVVIIGLIIVTAAISMDSTEDKDSALEETQLEESIPVEESEVEVVEEPEVEVVEEPEVEVVEESEVEEETGEDFSVEFTESVGLKTP